jgi:hypothetical protein
MKVKELVKQLLFVMTIAPLLAASGCCGTFVVDNGPTPTPIPTVDVSVSAAVRVIDLTNNTPVVGAPVYFVACAPNGSDVRDVHFEDKTAEDGWALFTANYTVDRDQIIYLGATNRKALIDSDFGMKNFNGSGYLGEWKAFDYSMLYNSVDNKATVTCTITVDEDSGKMI